MSTFEVTPKDAARACHLGFVDDKFSELLTLREMIVAVELCKGKADKEIAIELNVAVSTIKHHLRTLREKLGVSNRTHAALILSAVQLPETPAGQAKRTVKEKEVSNWAA